MTGVLERPNKLILVVDDDPTLRLLLRASLEKSGFQVEEAVDGVEAIRKYVSCKPAAILMDVDMPNLDGYGACARIRKDGRGAHVPILMVTGMEDLESVNQAYSAGATDFIPKPINWNLLGHRVRYVLRASQTFEKLRASEAKTDALVKAIPDTLFIVRRSGEIVDYLPGSNTGPLTEPRGDQQTIFTYLPGDTGQVWQKLLREVAMMKTSRQCDLTLGEEGDQHHYELQLVPYLNDLTLTIFREITDRKRAESRIHSLAYFDTLTGLPNRQRFQQQLVRAIETAERRNLKVAALYVDLDNFKRINDTLGHNFGDAVLKAIARRLERCVRADDTVGRADIDKNQRHLARLGGDEFVAILQNLNSEEEAAVVAERLREELMRPVKHQGHEFVVTSSIGVAVYPDDGDDIDSLLKNADVAMYQAKEAGRNSVRFYSGTMSMRSLGRLEMENALRQALQHDAFELHYQPKICVQTQKMVGVEALLRWEDPSQGYISPEQFIPLAEECGLIGALGEWVLQRACAQAKIWEGQFGSNFTMAVNLSSQQFLQTNIADVVLNTLFEASLDPHLLQLEITESILMNDLDETTATVQRIKDAGVSLAMDDFGTGYSSLSYLTRFPLDVLKIDRSFVIDLENNNDNAVICNTIIAMAHNLGLEVIAEGVETQVQFDYLRNQGCDQVQGFLFSKPVSAAEIERLSFVQPEKSSLMPVLD